jgi:DNA-binding NarL/FixJ family response regulator
MSPLRPEPISAPATTFPGDDGEDQASGRRRPKAYIVSDVLLYREGLSSHLHNSDRLDIVGAGPPTEETLRLLERFQPDAVILDLAMRNSIAFAEQIRDRVHRAKTVAFAASELDHHMVACAKARIGGYVLKDGTAEDIVIAVVHAVRDELHCSPKFAAMLLAKLAALAPEATAEGPGRAPKLTPREQQIFGQIGQGLSNKEIARRLGISSATVKNHVHRVLDKLSVHRRTQALAILHGHLDVAPSKLQA